MYFLFSRSKSALAKCPLELTNFANSNCDNKENNDNKKQANYENIQVEYISLLTKEGYSQQAVIRALGIAKNNLEMAKQILDEFVSKR